MNTNITKSHEGHVLILMLVIGPLFSWVNWRSSCFVMHWDHHYSPWTHRVASPNWVKMWHYVPWCYKPYQTVTLSRGCMFFSCERDLWLHLTIVLPLFVMFFVFRSTDCSSYLHVVCRWPSEHLLTLSALLSQRQIWHRRSHSFWYGSSVFYHPQTSVLLAVCPTSLRRFLNDSVIFLVLHYLWPSSVIISQIISLPQGQKSGYIEYFENSNFYCKFLRAWNALLSSNVGFVIVLLRSVTAAKCRPPAC